MRPTHLIVAALGIALAAGAPAFAQQKKGDGPPPPAPPKAYKAVTVTASSPMSDAALDTLRKEIGDLAAKKDRAALAARVVGKGFFWDRADGKKADAKKSGVDNLSAAFNIPDDEGWEALAAFASDATAAPSAEHKGAVCAPGPARFDEKAADQLAKTTGTELFEWTYIAQAGTEVREKADAKSPVVEKVDMILVRVYEDPKAGPDQGGEFTRIVVPSGKVGFVASDAIRPLQGDQICYVKDGAAWKIGGYVGGGGD